MRPYESQPPPLELAAGLANVETGSSPHLNNNNLEHPPIGGHTVCERCLFRGKNQGFSNALVYLQCPKCCNGILYQRISAASPSPVLIGIGLLTPECNNWRIEGVCTSKGDMQTVMNDTLKVFNFELTDENKDRIRIKSFGEIAEKIFPLVHLRSGYSLRNCGFEKAHKQINTTGHAHELTIRCVDDLEKCSGPESPSERLSEEGLNGLAPRASHSVSPHLANANDRKRGAPITITDSTSSPSPPKIAGASFSVPDNSANLAELNPAPDAPVAVPISLITDVGNTSVQPARRPAPATVVSQPVPRDSGRRVIPIKAITPYISGWRILGVCTSKENLKTVKNNDKETVKPFHFVLTDRRGNNIRITAFPECAESVSTKVQLERTFYLSNCTVCDADKKFNYTGHAYELTIHRAEDLKPSFDTIVRAPPFTHKAVPLNNIAEHAGTLVDVIGVVDAVNPLVEFTSRNGNELVKREVQIIDKSCTIVTLVLWSHEAQDFDSGATGRTIGIKGALVTDFNGRFTISSRFCVRMDPVINGVRDLLEWYQNERESAQTTTISISSTRTLDLSFVGAISSLKIEHNERVFVNVKGMLDGIKSDHALYKACSADGCYKKVILEHNQYRCEKCRRTSDTFKYQYMIQAEMVDMTGSQWVSLFGNAAEQLMGMSAHELSAIKESGGEVYDALFQAVKFKPFMFRLKARWETYRGQVRIRYPVMSVTPVNYDSVIPARENTLRMLRECGE